MRHVLLCLALTACADHPSKLDNASKTDPWTAGSDKDKSDKPAFDLKGILAKVGESIKTPGPYEAGTWVTFLLPGKDKTRSHCISTSFRVIVMAKSSV